MKEEKCLMNSLANIAPLMEGVLEMMGDMKESYYFSHDYNARHDRKLVRLRMKFGWAGYGLFWAMIEVMREQTAYKIGVADLDGLAYEFQVESELISEMVTFCLSDEVKLFDSDGEWIWSESLLRRMKHKDYIRKLKSDGGRKAMAKRWGTDEPKPLESEKEPDKKVNYAANVNMREKDYNTLITRFGDIATGRMIEILDNYKGSKGKRYKDDYRAILSWVAEKYKDEQEKEKRRKTNEYRTTTAVEAKVAARRKLTEEFLNT